MEKENPFGPFIRNLEKADTLNFQNGEAIRGSILYANRNEEIDTLLPDSENKYEYAFLASLHPIQYEARMLMLELQRRLNEPPIDNDITAEEFIDLAEKTDRKDWKRNMYLRKAAVKIAVDDRIHHDIRLPVLLTAIQGQRTSEGARLASALEAAVYYATRHK